jgi:hypothetical protein
MGNHQKTHLDTKKECASIVSSPAVFVMRVWGLSQHVLFGSRFSLTMLAMPAGIVTWEGY